MNMIGVVKIVLIKSDHYLFRQCKRKQFKRYRFLEYISPFLVLKHTILCRMEFSVKAMCTIQRLFMDDPEQVR